jgi:hypothetical protein
VTPSLAVRLKAATRRRDELKAQYMKVTKASDRLYREWTRYDLYVSQLLHQRGKERVGAKR